MNQTMQVALSCNLKHLSNNYRSVFLTITAPFPVRKNICLFSAAHMRYITTERLICKK
jgi:hypothetical protein